MDTARTFLCVRVEQSNKACHEDLSAATLVIALSSICHIVAIVANNSARQVSLLEERMPL